MGADCQQDDLAPGEHLPDLEGSRVCLWHCRGRQRRGRREQAFQADVLKGIELRRDIEETLLSNRVRKATDPRECAGILTWVAAANTSVGATGVVPTGDGTTALVEGTPRALTTALLNTQMLAMSLGGSKPGLIMMHPRQTHLRCTGIRH